MSILRILSSKGHYVETIAPLSTLADAIHKLALNRIGAVLVTDVDGAILGILSERDIVRALARGPDVLAEHVLAHMTARVVTCGPNTGLTEVMDEMTRGRFRHMPVVDQGKLIGIISIGDVVKHRLAEIEAETRAMRDYIATA